MTLIAHPLPIRTDQIDLWLLFTDDVTDEALLARYRALLTEEERAQELRFYFPKDQYRYLLTRALVRTMLSRYVPSVAPDAWRFTKNDYGRPVIANDDPLAKKIAFNISHTLGLVVLAITSESLLGVDVENLQRRQLSPGLADRFFAPSEAAALKLLPESEQPERFFEYWTLKESYIKARGMGLSIPLSQFSFHFSSESQVHVTTDAQLSDPNRWHFWQLRLTRDHLAAVCVQATAQRRLQVNRIVPLEGEGAFAASIFRQTPQA